MLATCRRFHSFKSTLRYVPLQKRNTVDKVGVEQQKCQGAIELTLFHKHGRTHYVSNLS